MEDCIRQAFIHVDQFSQHVSDGHYDLIGPNGDIILPQVWEAMIRPGWTVTMMMWPIPDKPPLSQRPPPPGHPLHRRPSTRPPPGPPPPPSTWPAGRPPIKKPKASEKFSAYISSRALKFGSGFRRFRHDNESKGSLVSD